MNGTYQHSYDRDECDDFGNSPEGEEETSEHLAVGSVMELRIWWAEVAGTGKEDLLLWADMMMSQGRAGVACEGKCLAERFVACALSKARAPAQAAVIVGLGLCRPN